MKNTVKNLAITEEVAINFKASYSAAMGGTQTVVFPNGMSFYFDDRTYYSGRGVKYNKSINHQLLGNVVISVSHVKDYVLQLNERAARIIQYRKNEKALELRLKEAKKNKIYTINPGGYVELSENESENKNFDAARLANTLKINIEDALLLNSVGKTYVFAKSEDGLIYQLYHSSLDCNALNIHVELATKEMMNGFKSEEWQNAPYASLVGQTANNNHFVC